MSASESGQRLSPSCTYDDRNVDVGGLLDGLGISARVRDDDQAGLLERAGDVVGEVTGGETASNGGGTRVGGELEDGTLSVGTGGDDADCVAWLAGVSMCCWRTGRIAGARLAGWARTVGRVVNGDDDAGSQDNLLPRLADVDDVDAVGPGLPQVGLHVHLEVLCAEVALGSEEHLNVLLGGVENGGEIAGSHFVGEARHKLGRTEGKADGLETDVVAWWWACRRTFGQPPLRARNIGGGG